MNFEPTDDQEAWREEVREFVDEEIVPEGDRIDKEDEFPHDVAEKIADKGYFGVPYGEEYGGPGKDYHSYAYTIEEIARGSGGLGTVVAAHGLPINVIDRFGTEEQKDEWMPPLVKGEKIGAFCLSERGAGSDVSKMTTTAEKDGDEYVIDGEKMWTSNGAVAGTAIIFAKTDPDAGGRGISAFVADIEDNDSFEIMKVFDKLGDHGNPVSEVNIDGLRVPEENMIGEEGAGLKQALISLNSGRVSIAARSVGIAQAALDASIDYVQEREQFGGPLSGMQAIQHKIADMDVKTENARLITHKAADIKERGNGNLILASSRAKLYASEVSREVTNEAVQLHGGYGYIDEKPIERYYRDARINEIYEGTSEIQRNTIAEQVLQ
ncbi:MAG: acyl-CoA dehydrogenase family protein [Halobacteria archaeon]|nr:acyl-CoA dehydrogenase family protein [Halobacteria archaeon]